MPRHLVGSSPLSPFPFFRKRAIIRVLEIAGDVDDADAALGQFCHLRGSALGHRDAYQTMSIVSAISNTTTIR
jgi:hypothetical protein